MNTQNTDISKYITQQYIDHFLNCTFPDSTPITQKIRLPNIGSHLITPRTGYTHHGIYIGKEMVIHYSGLADGLKSGPVKKLSLQEFHNGIDFHINNFQNQVSNLCHAAFAS